LISEQGAENKIKKVLDNVKNINWKTAKKEQKEQLTKKLDQIVDISACICNLKEVPCKDRRIHCKDPMCKERHITCECPPEKNVPICERAYLTDQRSRDGNMGRYQMSSSQRVATTRNVKINRSPAKTETASNDVTFIDVSNGARCVYFYNFFSVGLI